MLRELYNKKDLPLLDDVRNLFDILAYGLDWRFLYSPDKDGNFYKEEFTKKWDRFAKTFDLSFTDYLDLLKCYSRAKDLNILNVNNINRYVEQLYGSSFKWVASKKGWTRLDDSGIKEFAQMFGIKPFLLERVLGAVSDEHPSR